MPALNAGLRDGAVATVSYLKPPSGAALAEPIVLQITVEGREYLDCSQRLRELRLLETGGQKFYCPIAVKRGRRSHYHRGATSTVLPIIPVFSPA